ncbi:MAG: hypothetical protein MRERV_1c073 [Mycoplasmataceae bacterium RV_VA103A]|nr:MAG: hypothetical protein MRERV_1c073 [Mycoplasmataceae bacterium RV_VA103A]
MCFWIILDKILYMFPSLTVLERIGERIMSVPNRKKKVD